MAKYILVFSPIRWSKLAEHVRNSQNMPVFRTMTLSRSGWLTYPSHIMPVQAFSIFIFACLPERNIGVRIDQLLYPKYDLFALNHSIISPLCLVWVRVPLWAHVRQAKFCLRVCQVVFLGVLPFSPHLLIGPSHMS